jgi:aryl-alcohol dehydrogenase-like predicted oxidoreductase
LAQGVLTGKYLPNMPPPAGSRATDDKGGAGMISRWMQPDVLSRVQELARLAADAGLSVATMSLAWVLRNDNVSSAIIGASRPEQVRANVAAVDVHLDDDLVAAIDAIVDPIVERDPAQSAQLSRRPT